MVVALAGDEQALAAVRLRLPDAVVDPDPEHEHLVLDADSSQQTVIEAVRAGAHLVIKGPPGTGKSQTIANLVCTLAAEGKSVLFVAEKRAAIDAVLQRLDRLGLGDLVLDAWHDGASALLPVPTGVRRGAMPRVQVRPDGPVLVRGTGEWMDRDGRVHLLPR